MGKCRIREKLFCRLYRKCFHGKGDTRLHDKLCNDEHHAEAAKEPGGRAVRIYGRLLEMCTPVRFTGDDFRKAAAQKKMERLKKLMDGGESQ